MHSDDLSTSILALLPCHAETRLDATPCRAVDEDSGLCAKFNGERRERNRKLCEGDIYSTGLGFWKVVFPRGGDDGGVVMVLGSSMREDGSSPVGYRTSERSRLIQRRLVP